MRLYQQIRDNELVPPSEVSPAVRVPAALPEMLPPSPTAERRIATVLSVEVVGSRELLAEVGTEAWAEHLSRVLAVLASEVRRYDGEIAQLRQHGLLAYFGVDAAHEDDPERAVLAALAMQGSLSASDVASSLETDTDLRLRVSVNTGDVIVSEIGDEGGQAERAALGNGVVVAEGLQARADAGAMLVSASTQRLVKPLFEWASSRRVTVTGPTGTLTAYRPLAYRAPPDKGRDIAGVQSPLVGRESELAVLARAVGNLRAGLGGIATLVGEAGIGKSRLVAQARKYETAAGPDNPCWIEGRCLSYGAGFAYLRWQNLLRDLLGVAPVTPTPATSEALRSATRHKCPDRFDDVYPYLARLLSLPLEPEYDVVRRLEDVSLRAEITQATQFLLEGAARQLPLVVVCEDLHWADPTSLELIEKVLPLTDRGPLLVLLVFRPEREHGCWQMREHIGCHYNHRHSDLRLLALSQDESDILVGSLLEAGSPPAELQARVFSLSGGNPLFVEEIIRSLREDGLIAHHAAIARWQATVPDDTIPVPDSLHGVLAARIDRLPADAKRVVQMASVIGRIFSLDVLSGMAGDEPLDEPLLALVRRQLIRERARVPEVTYIFKHDLTREAACESLLGRDRREFHSKGAETIERLHTDRLEERLGLLAHHWAEGGEPEKAVSYLVRAADQAYAAYAQDEAETYYLRAMRLLDVEGIGASDSVWRLKALGGLGRLYFVIGRLVEAQEYLDQAVTLGRATGLSARGMARLFYWLAEVSYWQNRPDDRIRIGEEGLALLGEDTGCVEAALMNNAIAISLWATGNREQSYEYAARTQRFIRGLPYTEELAGPYESIVLVCLHRDRDVHEAMNWVSEMEQQAERGNDLQGQGSAYGLMAYALELSGDLRGASESYRRALDCFSTTDGDLSLCIGLGKLSSMHTAMGDLKAPNGYARRWLGIAQAIGNRLQLAEAPSQVGLISLCQGSYEGAANAFGLVAEVSHDLGDAGREAWGLFCLGRVRLVQGDRAAATQSLLASARLVPPNGASHLGLIGPLSPMLVYDSLEAACRDAEEFRAYWHTLREPWAQAPPAETPPSHRHVQWFLEPAEAQDAGAEASQCGLEHAQWIWSDPFADCSFVLEFGLEIHAANGRGLDSVNRSAPRLLRPVQGDLAAQTITAPVSTSGGVDAPPGCWRHPPLEERA